MDTGFSENQYRIGPIYFTSFIDEHWACADDRGAAEFTG
jgi:hypothetical protein